MLIELLQNYLIEEGHRLLANVMSVLWVNSIEFLGVRFEHVKVAAERDQVALELGRDLLPLAPRAVTVACAVVAVPILVADDVVQALVEVGLEAEGAKLAFAFVVDHFLVR